MRMPSSSSSSQSPSLPPKASSSKGTRRRGDKDGAKLNKASYPLQRGSACLSCRKRKMKCDAGKPACSQCAKANRASDCDYDDGKSKSRTQLLQEKISTLESRLRDLEAPSSSSSKPGSSYLPNYPHPDSMYGAAVDPALLNGSPSSFDLTSLSNTGSPTGTPGSPESLWVGDPNDLHLSSQQGLRAPSGDLHWNIDPLSLPPDELFKVYGQWWEADMPPPRISQSLLDIFLPHRHQCGYEINVNRFRASLNSGQPPHPALLNAIYALACHFSMSPVLAPYVSHFTSRALRGIFAALEASDSLVNILQASCLLAVLFFIKGRLLEGYYHAGAAARMAIGLGLHQIAIFDREGPSSSDGAPGSNILGPPTSSAELGDRILTFWQVYNLDRCWAVATGLPVALAEDGHPRNRIQTTWPRTLEEYELGHFSDSEVPCGVNYLTYRSRDSIHALRAKASTLFERASRLSLAYVSSPQNSDQFWSDYHNLDTAISRLTLSLPPIRASVDDERVNVSMFVIHSLLHGATIQLHSPFVPKDTTSRQKSIGAGTQATSMIQELDDVDYSFLDPIMGTCWTTVAEAILREFLPVNHGITMDQDYNTLNAQLDLIVMAMNRLGTVVPLVAYQANKVEQSRTY